jgi:hypothetical protein
MVTDVKEQKSNGDRRSYYLLLGAILTQCQGGKETHQNLLESSNSRASLQMFVTTVIKKLTLCFSAV